MQVIFKVELFDLSCCGAVRPKPQEQIDVAVNGFSGALDLLEGLGKAAKFLVDKKLVKHCTAIIERAENMGCQIELVETPKIESVKYLWWHKLPLDLYTALYKPYLSKYAVPVWLMTESIYNRPYGLPSAVSGLAGSKIRQRIAKILTN